jgi:hypothetical protein
VPRYTRRRVVTGAAVVAAGLAGCAGDGGAGDAARTGTDTATTDSEATAAADLDLREANVVGVRVERRDDGHRFDVTLHHDDDGEAGYANWWQVETLGGDRLGRRELAHPHGTREFTRSATVPIPDGTACVVVRGHDRTHGYGGRAMVMDVETGTTRVVRQGSDRQSVTDADC